MTKGEKESLFELLETSRRFLCGGDADARPCPEFSDDLDQTAIRDGVLACGRCPLAKIPSRAVPGTGSERPIVLIVGDAPTSTDAPEYTDAAAPDKSAINPIGGKAGELLDRMLSAINLSRDTNAYLTNVIKCRPVEDRAIDDRIVEDRAIDDREVIDRMPETDEPNNAEISLCMPWLEAELAVMQPLAILALGETAFRFLTGREDCLERIHGTFLESSGIPLMPTYHPREILSDGELKRPAWEDLKALRAFLAERSPAYADEIARLSSQGR